MTRIERMPDVRLQTRVSEGSMPAPGSQRGETGFNEATLAVVETAAFQPLAGL